MKLIIIRHGQAQHNLGSEKKHTFAGQEVDESLSVEGIDTVTKLADVLKNRKIDKIFSSTLKRSLQTAEIIAKETGKPTEAFAEGCEIDIGRFAGLTEEEAKMVYPDEATTFYNGDIPNWSFPGGENFEQVQRRIGALVTKIKETSGLGDTALFCGHGMFNRVIFYIFLRDRKDLWQERTYPHDRIVELEV